MRLTTKIPSRTKQNKQNFVSFISVAEQCVQAPKQFL